MVSASFTWRFLFIFLVWKSTRAVTGIHSCPQIECIISLGCVGLNSALMAMAADSTGSRSSTMWTILKIATTRSLFDTYQVDTILILYFDIIHRNDITVLHCGFSIDSDHQSAFFVQSGHDRKDVIMNGDRSSSNKERWLDNWSSNDVHTGRQDS